VGILVLSRRDVRSVIDRPALMEAVALALVELSTGKADVPDRQSTYLPARGARLLSMPGHLPGLGGLGAKLLTVFPSNTSLPTHQGVTILFDPDTGQPAALIDAADLTAERTAATSALATRELARPDSCLLGVIGTGAQARSHLRYLPLVCPWLIEIRVAGTTPSKASAFAAAVRGEVAVPVRPVESGAEAMADADVVCATTSSRDPVVIRSSLKPGAHVNSVGFRTDGREVDAETVIGSLLVVESRKAALASPPVGSNDLVWPMRDRLMDESHVHAELGELLNRSRPGRAEDAQITLFKSVGVAAQDLAAAIVVEGAARERGIGHFVEL